MRYNKAKERDMPLDKIESKIIAYIREAVKKVVKEDSSSKWTKAIKKKLLELGHKLGYRVYATHRRGLKSDGKEWINDLCWVKENKREKILKA
mgnify:CR=1 FL=1